MNALVTAIVSIFFKNGKEYLLKTFLDVKTCFSEIINSAFLFSTAKNKDISHTVRRNHGESYTPEAIPPAIARSKKPDAMHCISKRGLFLSLKE